MLGIHQSWFYWHSSLNRVEMIRNQFSLYENLRYIGNVLFYWISLYLRFRNHVDIHKFHGDKSHRNCLGPITRNGVYRTNYIPALDRPLPNSAAAKRLYIFVKQVEIYLYLLGLHLTTGRLTATVIAVRRPITDVAYRFDHAFRAINRAIFTSQ